VVRRLAWQMKIIPMRYWNTTKAVSTSFLRFCISSGYRSPRKVMIAWRQGLTLVHFSAQRKCFLWERGYI